MVVFGFLLLAGSFAGQAASSQQRPTLPPPMPAGPSFHSHFQIQLPKTVKVLHYYGDSIGMDPSFAWHLGSVEDRFLRQFVRSAKLTKRPAGRKLSTFTTNWGSWWNAKRIEQLPEVYYSDGGCFVRAWYDRKSKELWVEFINT